MLIALFFLFGCEKDSTIDSRLDFDYTIPFSNSAKNNDNLYYNIEEDGIQKIADLHNVILSEALLNFECLSKNCKDELWYSFKRTNYYYVNKEYLDIIPNYLKESYEETLERLLSESALNYIRLSKEIVSDNIQNYEKISILLDELEFKLKVDNLIDIEQKTILLYIKTLKNSSYFWLPETAHASGEGYNYITMIGFDDNIDLIISADALGAAGAFIGGAFVTAATGGSGIGIFYMVGWAAAWSSGMSLLGAPPRDYLLPN